MKKITMLGAGSGFVINIAREITEYESLKDAKFVLMDVDQERLDKAADAVSKILAENAPKIELKTTIKLGEALDGSDYVIISCEQNRYPNWIRDVEIPLEHRSASVYC